MFEQRAQRRDRRLRLLELALHAAQVRGDRRVASADVGRVDDRADVLQRHPELAQPADHLRDRHLCDRVVPVAAARIDPRRREEPDLVVVTQRLHAHKRHPREVADGQVRFHARHRRLAGGGRVKWMSPLARLSLDGGRGRCSPARDCERRVSRALRLSRNCVDDRSPVTSRGADANRGTAQRESWFRDPRCRRGVARIGCRARRRRAVSGRVLHVCPVGPNKREPPPDRLACVQTARGGAFGG